MEGFPDYGNETVVLFSGRASIDIFVSICQGGHMEATMTRRPTLAEIRQMTPEVRAAWVLLEADIKERRENK